jgi:hypothetical protein
MKLPRDLRLLDESRGRNVGVVSHGTAANRWEEAGTGSCRGHSYDRIPDDAAAVALRVDRNHGALRKQPGAVGLPTSEPFPNGIARRLVTRAPDGSTDDINAPTLEADIVGVAPKVRGAEILNPATPVWEWPRWMLGKETPDVQILHAMLAAKEVLGTALA